MKKKLIIFLPVLFVLSACQLGYIFKQGMNQLDLVRKSQPIEKVLSNYALDSTQRERLELVLEVRKYAEQKLALHIGNNYTTVNIKWNKYMYNVSASNALQFKAYLWWFPIIGHVPYLGFFDKKDALKEKEALLKKGGLDVSLSQVGGYSTLGYFSDPVWPQMLETSQEALVELIIHELTHGTLFFTNQADFNESLANYVGKKGTLLFYEDRYGGDSQELKNVKAVYEDEDRYMAFMWALYHRLDKLYGESLNDEQKLQQKKALLQQAIQDFSSLPFKTEGYKKASIKNINNASLMMFGRYNRSQACFDKLLKQKGGNWALFFEELKRLQNEPEPLDKFKEMYGCE